MGGFQGFSKHTNDTNTLDRIMSWVAVGIRKRKSECVVLSNILGVHQGSW